MPWGPAIDGVVLPELPLKSLKAGNFNKVPVLLGTNKNEGSIFIPVFPLIVGQGTSFPPKKSDIPLIVEHSFNMFNASQVDSLTNSLVCVTACGRIETNGRTCISLLAAFPLPFRRFIPVFASRPRPSPLASQIHHSHPHSPCPPPQDVLLQ